MDMYTGWIYRCRSLTSKTVQSQLAKPVPNRGIISSRSSPIMWCTHSVDCQRTDLRTLLFFASSPSS
jgi:hypothetical protein